MARMSELAKSKYWQAEQAQEVIEAWRASGESVSAFCRTWDIKPKRLRYWLKGPEQKRRSARLGASSSSESTAPSSAVVFHELSVQAPAEIRRPGMERAVVARVERGQWSVVVPHGFDQAELGRLFCVLEGV